MELCTRTRTCKVCIFNSLLANMTEYPSQIIRQSFEKGNSPADPSLELAFGFLSSSSSSPLMASFSASSTICSKNHDMVPTNKSQIR